ncbi:potassium transporter [uncultured bacterium]|nr:potassium transporter [uncultured bacterium]
MITINNILLLSAIAGTLVSEILKINIILTGIIIGFLIKSILNIHIPIYDLGILVTMLIMGHHLELKTLNKHKKTALITLFISIALIAINSIIVSGLLKLDQLNSLVISTSLCMSSTLICHKILEDEKASSTNYGRITIISTIVQDIIGICLLVFLHLNIMEIKQTIIQHIFLFLFLLIFVFFKKRFYNLFNLTIFNTIIDAQKEYNVKTSLLTIILFSGYCTLIPLEEWYFLMGLFLKDLISNLKYEINYIQMISMSLMFMFVGCNIDLLVIKKYIFQIFELFVITTVIKLFLLYIGIFAASKNIDASIRSSILLSTCSELTFFIISIIKVNHYVSNIIFATTMLSMILNPLIYNTISKSLDVIQQRNIGIARYAAKMHIMHINKYVLIIGINEITNILMQELGSLLIDTVAIDNKLEKVLDNNKNCYLMDALSDDTYKILDINKAYCIIVLISNIKVKNETISKITKSNPDISIYVIVFNKDINSINKNKQVVPVFTNTTKSGEIADALLINIKENLN